MKKSLLAALCAAFAMTALPASALTYISNLDQPDGFAVPVSNTDWLAQKFKTDGSASAFTLDSVTVGLGDAPGGGGNFFVKIYNTTGSEGAWLPNNSSVLGTLSGNADPSTQGDYTYTASGITLQANTNYWIVLGVSGAGSYSWYDTNSTTTTGTWTITTSNTDAYSFDSGSSWNNADASPYTFSVNASAVPEPTGMVLLLSGAGVLAFVRRCRGARC